VNLLPFLLLVLLGSPDATSGEPAVHISPPSLAPAEKRPAGSKTFRRHFVASDKQGNIYYQATEIAAFSNTTDSTTLLVWDTGAARGLHFVRMSDFAKKLVTYRIEEPDGRAYISLEFPTQFVSTTREATLKEARENPVLYDTVDTPLTIATNSYRRTATESQWKDVVESRKWRSEARSSMSSTLLESLERLRGGMLSAPTVELFHSLLLRYIFHGSNEVAPLTVTTAPPDCAFDAELDHPCSEAQLRRVKEAEKDGKLLELY
jgi:hypothetical protein